MMMTIRKIKNKFNYLVRFPEFNHTFAIFLFLAITLFALTFSYYSEIKKERLENVHNLALSTSENLKQYVLRVVYRAEAVINQAQVQLEEIDNHHKQITTEAISKIYYDLLPQNDTYLILVRTDKEGHYIANSEWHKDPQKIELQKKLSLADREYFQYLKNHVTNELIVSRPIISRSTKKWGIVVAKRRFNKNNEFLGVDLMTISSQKLAEFFKLANPETNSTIALYNNENYLITRYPYDDSEIGKIVPLVHGIEKYNDKEKFYFEGICPLDKKLKVYGVSKLDNFNLKVMWGMASSTILSEVNNRFKYITGMEILILLMSFYFLYSKYKNLEKVEMLQVQEANTARMAMIGEFASGIAHEINNPLSIIIGNAKNLMRKNAQGDYSESPERLKKILDTSERIAKIVIGLKNLGHSPKENEFEHYSLQKILSDVMQVVNVKLQENNISFKMNFDHDIEIVCIPSLVGQVFLNLFSNSIYEIRNLNERWIDISIEYAPARGSVKILFTDSGLGIPEEVRSKLMKTFFTTKPTGEGTGLGLSICRKIIKQQNGDLYIDEKCQNTRFVVELKSDNQFKSAA